MKCTLDTCTLDNIYRRSYNLGDINRVYRALDSIYRISSTAIDTLRRLPFSSGSRVAHKQALLDIELDLVT